MPIWLLFALGTVVAWSAYAITSRTIARKSESPLALTISYGAYAGLFALIPALWEPWIFSDITATVIFVTFLATVGFGIYDIFQFYGRRYLEASQSTVLFQFAPVVNLFLAILLLGETITWLKLLAVALIVSGNVIAIYKRGSAVSMRGVVFILLAAAGVGAAYIADKFALPHYPIPLYAFITYTVPILYCFILLLIRREPLQLIAQEAVRGSWRLPLLAFVGVAGYYLALKTFLLTEVSNAVPVLYSSTILTALAGILILNERGGMVQKLVGAVITVAGVVLLQTA